MDYTRDAIKRIAVEEMVRAHDVLNAIGGHPVIASPEGVPKFPGPRPMGAAGGVVVRLRRYSKTLLEATFTKIEEPDHPPHIPTLPRPRAFAKAPLTIGEFYGKIRARIADPDLFVGDNARQVTAFGKNHRVSDVKTAQKAIDLIVQHSRKPPQLAARRQKATRTSENLPLKQTWRLQTCWPPYTMASTASRKGSNPRLT